MPDLCYNCFNETAEGGICARCGYNAADDDGRFRETLKHGSILNGRYITGRVLHQSGCIASYIARDYKTRELVCVRECLPVPMAERSNRNEVLLMQPELASEFHSIKVGLLAEAKILSSYSKLPNVINVRGFFEENSTVYMVTDYAYGINLSEYVKACGGKVEPGRALKLLGPVIDTVSAIHETGVIHRNIAPESIIITRGQIPVLISFGEAANISQSGYLTLDAIFSSVGQTGDKQNISSFIRNSGFAAPEQYSRTGRQAYHTDVYALAALLYYAITGVVPEESVERLESDRLLPPGEYGVTLGPKAESALMKALSVRPQDRYSSVKEFISDFKISARTNRKQAQMELPHTSVLE